MKTYSIVSKGGMVMGYYDGENPAEALAVMHRDAGYTCSVEDGEVVFASDVYEGVCGGVDAWIIRQVKYHVSHRHLGCWTVIANGEFESEDEADRALEALKSDLRWDELRVLYVVC